MKKGPRWGPCDVGDVRVGGVLKSSRSQGALKRARRYVQVEKSSINDIVLYSQYCASLIY
jgi:hypothetical protein